MDDTKTLTSNELKQISIALQTMQYLGITGQLDSAISGAVDLQVVTKALNKIKNQQRSLIA